jgi:hypothetical protein
VGKKNLQNCLKANSATLKKKINNLQKKNTKILNNSGTNNNISAGSLRKISKEFI